ncbi:MAG: DNA polymerase III subunit epsilon [Candidatus Tokpelaia sp. JSC189]|nr:MAG: DNA polymerase III subunit epsilon [Candidatus Tokpelaia sp. JSC189]
MREIIFDTETTGLNRNEDRIIEIGCIELDNRFPTGRTFHVYINPQGRQVHPDALAIHGISNEQLVDKLIFPEISEEFLDFTDGARLVAHNAMFDLGFINAELERIGQLPISVDRIVDTLALARHKHPMGPNSLDALCKRYGIDNSRRTLHGALLDSEILTDVYIELIGGRQGVFSLDGIVNNPHMKTEKQRNAGLINIKRRLHPLPLRLTKQEQAAHIELLKKIGDKALWFKHC